MIGVTSSAVAPVAPGRLGQPMTPEEALRYLGEMGGWRDQRKAELDLLDAAAMDASDQSAFTGDMLLSMALWKAVADRCDLLLATWDSGRVGRTELERLSTLVWGRLDATLDPSGSRLRPQAANTALAVSLPEACRLSDALASSLRARLGIDPSSADVAARVRQLRASVERVRDLVDREPAAAHQTADTTLEKLDSRVTELAARNQRGADVGGLLGPLENDIARVERDLIVGAATRQADAQDETRARQLRRELEARGAAVRILAERCVAQVAPAPRLAVPDVAALGPVPTESRAVDAYLVRLHAVGRAMTMAQDAYAAALSERDELRGRLEAYAVKAAARHAPPASVAGSAMPADARGALAATASGDLASLAARAREALDREPADMPRARALLAAYQAYLASADHQTGGSRRRNQEDAP